MRKKAPDFFEVRGEVFYPKKEFADILIKEVDRLNRVLEDFLRFARPVPVKRDSFSPNQVIKDVLDLARQQAQRNNVKIELQLVDDIEMHGVGEQIKQALLNLVLNALQAMPDGGSLQVSTQLHKGELHISVEDNGPGISPEYRERIFNPFVTTRDTGTGLGLAITQRIVQSHEGKIVLRSQPGEGSVFTICLPVDQHKGE